jgi:hypothetical protein
VDITTIKDNKRLNRSFLQTGQENPRKAVNYLTSEHYILGRVFFPAGSEAVLSSPIPFLPCFIPLSFPVMTCLPPAHHPLLSRDLSLFPQSVRKPTFTAGGRMRAARCCLPSVGEVGCRIPIRHGLSKLCFGFSLRVRMSFDEW